MSNSYTINVNHISINNALISEFERVSKTEEKLTEKSCRGNTKTGLKRTRTISVSN